MHTITDDWIELFRRLGIRYQRRSTGALYVLCLFHWEKTPSFRVWPDTGLFRCFGCGRMGTIEDVVIHFYGELDSFERWRINQRHYTNELQLYLPFEHL